MFELKTEAVEVGGHLKVRATVAEEGRVVDGELVNPFNGRQRRAVAQRLASRGPADAQDAMAEEIERRVLEAAEAYRASGGRAEASAGVAVDDVDEQEGSVVVVRPELFVMPHVVGVSVPETVRLGDGSLRGRWRLYCVTTAGGRRWRAELDEVIEVPQGAARAGAGVAGGTLCIRPVPGDPTLPCNPAWSAASRKLWLAGGGTDSDDAGVTAREVFAEVYAALDEYLDVGQDAPSGGSCSVTTASRQTNGSDGASPSRDGASPSRDGASPSREPRGATPGILVMPDDRPEAHESRRLGRMLIDRWNLGVGPAPHPVLSTLTLWTMLTYCYPAWDAVPYLYVGGPAGSGKTRVFELLLRLVFRPLASSNVSAPALFRTLHERGGTLLLDEAERLKEGAPEVAEIRSILLAGYKRGGKASRLESAGESYRMAEFDVFGPKAIACIAGVEGPLATRCVGVQMMRSAPDSPRPRRRIDRDPSRWQRLRDILHECLLGEMGRSAPLLSETPEVCPLGGRAGEIWQPLLALATLVDERGEWKLHGIMTRHAIESSEAAKDDHFPEEALILLTALTRKVLKGEKPTPGELLKMCQMRDDRLFAKWRAQKVSYHLKQYGIVSTKGNKGRRFTVPLEHLKRIEQSYEVDLNTEGREPQLFIGGTCTPPAWKR